MNKTNQPLLLTLITLLVLSAPVPSARAKFMTGSPAPEFKQNPQTELLKEIDLEQKLNRQIPLNLPFRDAGGKAVTLGDYFGEKPVVLTLVYYECPMLCNMVLNGFTRALRAIPFDVGEEFDVLTVSFSPEETPEQAAAKRAHYLEQYGRASASDGWHYLVGESAAIERLTEAVGFRYRYDQASEQYAHTTGIMVLTPEGKLARYFYGVEFPPKDLRLSVVEAAERKIGTPVDKVLLWCFHYDPVAGKYGFAIVNALRVMGVLTLGALGGFVVVMLRRDRREARS